LEGLADGQVVLPSGKRGGRPSARGLAVSWNQTFCITLGAMAPVLGVQIEQGLVEGELLVRHFHPLALLPLEHLGELAVGGLVFARGRVSHIEREIRNAVNDLERSWMTCRAALPMHTQGLVLDLEVQIATAPLREATLASPRTPPHHDLLAVVEVHFFAPLGHVGFATWIVSAGSG
jgi:hypothetical protein